MTSNERYKKLKAKFIEKCNEKLRKNRKTTSDIAKSCDMGKSTVEDFFANKSDTKIGTVIRIINTLNCELKV